MDNSFTFGSPVAREAETLTQSAREALNSTVSKLNEAVSRWNDNVVRDKTVSSGLSSAVTSYSSYLSQLNTTLESQLQQFQGHLQSEVDYGQQLERLKTEFEQRVEGERQLHAQVQERYEKLVHQGGMLFVVLCGLTSLQVFCAAAG